MKRGSVEIGRLMASTSSCSANRLRADLGGKHLMIGLAHDPFFGNAEDGFKRGINQDVRTFTIL